MKRFVLFLLVLAGSYAYAQEFRGALTGQVTDPTGAAIPNAQVDVTSTTTGAQSHTVTGAQGFYNVPFLAPGEYQVSVAAAGFKNYVQTGINVLTGQTMTVNVRMAIGNSSTSVTVHADAPLIDTGDASAGEVMSADELEDLPSNGRTPLGFARDAYGAIPKMKHATAAATPFQGSTADDFSLGGGLSSSNELLLNGVPNMQDSSRTALFSPQMDSVSSVRVDEFNANASMGDTSGGTIDITTKAGTNQFHGAASEFYYDPRVGSAKPFLTIPGASIVSSHYNQFGGAIGGPVWIPKIFNGRNKLFFEYAYEGYIGAVPPSPTVSEVPTCAERGQNAPTGSSLFCTDNAAGTPDYPDFSALLTANSAYQLYDPFSSTGSGATFARAKIPNNQFVNATNAAGGTGIALDPVARDLLQYVPAPNTTATATSTGENNYSTYSPNPANYKSHMLRLDYNISQSNKIFGEAHRGKYLTSGSDYFHDLATGTITDQIYSGGLVDDVQTFTPTLTLDSRLGMSRYQNVNSEKSAGALPSSFGLPTYIDQNSTAKAMPRINFTDSVSPVSIGVVPGSLEFQDTIQLFEMLTKVHGRHTYKAGVDIRAQKQSNLSPGNANGAFSFTSNTGTNIPIAVNDNSNANTVPFGGAFALFAMGVVTGGSGSTENINQAYQYNNWYQAYFIQDDWKAASNLTVSIGLRMEHETPEVESQNRIVAGWNPTATNAMTAASAAAYGPALTADAGSLSLPYLPTSINPTGGAIYATSSNRSAYYTAPIYLSPRVGISWAPTALHQKTVLRLGLGVYTNPFSDFVNSGNSGQAYGFSATSTVNQNGVVTSNTQLPWTMIDNPFPTTAAPNFPASPIVPVTGSGYGINQNLDQAMQFDAPVKVPYTERVSVDLQHQFGTNWMIEVGYILAHGVHTTYNNMLSSVPILPFLNRGPYNNAALSSALTSTATGFGIANPFLGLGAPYTNSQSMLTAAKITAQQALSPWPEYSSVQEDLIPGASTEFNALNTRLQKRMSYGLDMNITFTYSKLLATAQNNAGGPLNYQENSSDFPLKLNAQVIYDLPFGIGRQWMNHNRILDEGLGGWEISTNYGYLSGAVISWGNSVYQGDGSWKDFAMHAHAYSTSVPAFNIATIYNAKTNSAQIGTTPAYSVGAPGTTNYRTFPQNLLRQDHENNWDMSMFKGFRMGDWALLQLRIDAFNAFNRPQFTNASTSTGSPGSFGLVNNPASGSAARQLQGGLHLVF